MKNIFDTHNHCEFSFDGKRTTALRSAQSAYEKGLGGIIFTDHCDLWTPPGIEEKDQGFDIKAQQEEIDRVQGQFRDGFKVLKGIEIGMHPESIGQVREIMSEYEFDQVIASVHYLDNADPYDGSYFEGKDWKQAYGLYLETIYNEAVRLGDFDIIGHFDYVARYAPYPQDGITYKDFGDVLDAIFRLLIENGKALEINTKKAGGGRTRPTTPDKDLLLRYRQLGGEILSLGSDSHVAEGVAVSFGHYIDLLRSLGFRWNAHYEKRQLVQLPL